MLDKLPKDIQEYTTKNNENAEISYKQSLSHIEINNIELEIKDDYKKNLDNIASYLERNDVKSLNTNSIILYEKLWNDVEIILNAPNKNEIYNSWDYGTACIEKALLFLFTTTAFIYAEKELNINIYDNRLRFFFNLVMYLYH
jgi:hypothetical protein